MSNRYYTISELAELTNSSYQSIYQRMNTTLKDYVVVKGGKKLLNSDVLRAFNIDTNKEENKEDFKDNFNDSSRPPIDTNEADLIEIIKSLQTEIKQKDEVIQKQSEQIINLSERITTLFENSQKLQLQTSYLISDNSNDNSQADEYGGRVDEVAAADVRTKKGIISKLFRF